MAIFFQRGCATESPQNKGECKRCGDITREHRLFCGKGATQGSKVGHACRFCKRGFHGRCAVGIGVELGDVAWCHRPNCKGPFNGLHAQQPAFFDEQPSDSSAPATTPMEEVPGA
ncbi:hypothetical protein CYMTET_42754 [Cymbomonas tetramitiformis]|uniref:Uncharacterized protein n=1 Tax=Cymbomonas tetramitiformis TaxID=36881 RepID=A0AAE0C3M4_9CHLO|nr:hypothetical protein CYMTET_42754 [Cymbomonas tetramitiformis]